MKRRDTSAPHGDALWVLLDVDVMLRGDPDEVAPGLLPSLVALFAERPTP